jgi:hypothetical protein
MTTYTANELATRTLRELGLLDASEDPSAEDLAWAVETNGSEILMLSAIGLPIWNGSEISVPQEYLTTLARRCALAVAPAFGLMSLSDAQMAMREAERVLTMMASPRGAVNPSAIKTNDSSPFRVSPFNFTTGN